MLPKMQNGSALLAMLLMSAVVTLCIVTVWRTTSYTMDVALVRQRYHQERVLIESILHWGVAWVAEQKDELFIIAQTRKQPLELSLSHDAWDLDDKHRYQMKLQIVAEQRKIVLNATLQQQQKTLRTAMCEMAKVPFESQVGKQEPLMITAWNVS